MLSRIIAKVGILVVNIYRRDFNFAPDEGVLADGDGLQLYDGLGPGGIYHRHKVLTLSEARERKIARKSLHGIQVSRTYVPLYILWGLRLQSLFPCANRNVCLHRFNNTCYPKILVLSHQCYEGGVMFLN